MSAGGSSRCFTTGRKSTLEIFSCRQGTGSAATHQNEQYCTVSASEWGSNRRKAAGSNAVSIGLILVIILVISPFGDFSDRFAEGVPHFVRVSRDRRSINRQ